MDLPSLVGEGLGVGSVTSKIWFGGKKLRGGMGDMGGLFSVFANLRARTRENSYGSPVRYQCH